MEPIVTSFVLVAVSEMGDKTQLLAFSLASRYRRPWVVMAGILVATVLNHALAASVGTWVETQVPTLAASAWFRIVATRIPAITTQGRR